ncbi:hypothetical protein [Aeribacillus sp. FSL M8-0235]|uniref:hypothetical protein n=1 Tax=Aeribacillus sp. FSL M8-0235 TaxID=2954576 RepID=UPI0030FD0FC8
MKIKTLLIAPYPGLKELALTLGKEQQSLDITYENKSRDSKNCFLQEKKQSVAVYLYQNYV